MNEIIPQAEVILGDERRIVWPSINYTDFPASTATIIKQLIRKGWEIIEFSKSSILCSGMHKGGSGGSMVKRVMIKLKYKDLYTASFCYCQYTHNNNKQRQCRWYKCPVTGHLYQGYFEEEMDIVQVGD